MEIFNDIMSLNKMAFKKSVKSISNNWLIIFTGIIYTVLNIAMFSLINMISGGILSIITSLIGSMFTAALISNFLYLLFNIINYDRISIQIFKDGFKYFWFKIYYILMIGHLTIYLFSIVGNNLGFLYFIISIVIYLGAFLVLNPLPETIYLKSYDPWGTIQMTFEFMKENWLNWLIPNAIFFLVLYVITGSIITNIFITNLSLNMFRGIKNIGFYIIGQLIFSFFMIYRGHLYKALSGSTRRKRMFMNKF